MTEGMAEIGCRGSGVVSTFEERTTFEPRPEEEVGDSQSGWSLCKALRLQRAWCAQATEETREGNGSGMITELREVSRSWVT